MLKSVQNVTAVSLKDVIDKQMMQYFQMKLTNPFSFKIQTYCVKIGHQTNRHIDRQRKTDRQTDTHTHTHTHKPSTLTSLHMHTEG